jgi:hypothetical protein
MTLIPRTVRARGALAYAACAATSELPASDPDLRTIPLM